MTKQEMFDKAVRGLRSQGFYKCVSEDSMACVYADGNGNHCAWGWVDPETWDYEGGVSTLANMDCGGLARRLKIAGDYASLTFAEHLQTAHDSSLNPAQMEAYLRAVGAMHELTWPEDV